MKPEKKIIWKALENHTFFLCKNYYANPEKKQVKIYRILTTDNII